jgi:hypothetical protein
VLARLLESFGKRLTGFTRIYRLTKKILYGISITDLQTFAKHNAHHAGQTMVSNQEVSEISLDTRFQQEPDRVLVEIV